MLLSIARDATLAEIKAAYHRVLLQSHPDKRNSLSTSSTNHVDIALIKEAHITLSNPELRAAYDARSKHPVSIGTSPRPAQVISLEDFDDEGAANSRDDPEGPWKYSCRCGGVYRINTSMLERGEHLVACSSCSETVWVGYEVFEDA